MATWRDGTTDPRLGSVLENTIIEYKEQVPTAFTDTAVGEAVTSLGATGGIVRLLPGTYAFTSGVTIPRNVHVVGAGPQATTIDHDGDDAAFLCRDSDAFSAFPNRSITGVSITGNSGSLAVGVDTGNSWGFCLRNVSITGYTGGRAIRLLNEDYWSEGFTFENLMIRNSATAIELVRTDGTDSFAYQRWRNVAISVPASGVGIDFGGASASDVYVYNSDFDCSIWLDGNNAVAVKVRAVADVVDSRFNITGEMSGGYTGTVGIQNLGGQFVGFGRASINSASDSIASGTTLMRPHFEVLDSGVSDGTVTYKQFTTSNKDNRYSGQMGVFTGSNIDGAFVGGYGGGGKQVFRVVSVGFEGTTADGDIVLSVDSGGWIQLLSGAYIGSGTGSPEGARSAGVGSLWLRTDGGAGTTLYVKESGSGNTGWNAISA